MCFFSSVCPFWKKSPYFKWLLRWIWHQDWKRLVPAFQCLQPMKHCALRQRHPVAMVCSFLGLYSWLPGKPKACNAPKALHFLLHFEAMRPLKQGLQLGEYTGEARRYDLWCEEIKVGQRNFSGCLPQKQPTQYRFFWPFPLPSTLSSFDKLGRRGLSLQ